jgi:hypothetical protein
MDRAPTCTEKDVPRNKLSRALSGRPFIFMEHPLSLEWYQIKTKSVYARLADYIVYKYFQNNDEKHSQVRMYTAK